jgi:N-acetylglucosamine kinase-like BadF-type ATPase
LADAREGSSLPAVLAIDGGNSKTDVALVADDGTLLASIRGPGASQEDHGIDGAMRLLGEMVRKVAALAGLTGASGSASPPGDGASSAGLVARHTSSCLAGADLPEEEEQLAAALRRQDWSLTSAVANDTFAVLRAGLTPAAGERPWGVAVTCGAGINCVGLAPDGRTTRFLALGPLTGDWGGGSGLSQEVMWWSMRAEDGRGPDTALRPATAAYFGLPTVTDVAIGVHLGHIGEIELLGLTTVLFEAASAGDKVARDLLEHLAEEICTMALTAMRRLGLITPGTPVVFGGGLLAARHPLLTAAIERRLAGASPGALPHFVDIPPVAGAALLGLDYLGAGPDAERRLRAATRLSPEEAAG